MPTLSLAPLPEQPSRLCKIDHSETLAIFDHGLGDHVISNKTHVFERESLFWLPASWMSQPQAALAERINRALGHIYEENRRLGFRTGQETGDFNYQALLEASGAILSEQERAQQPWKGIFRLYEVSDDGTPKLISREAMQALAG